LRCAKEGQTPPHHPPPLHRVFLTTTTLHLPIWPPPTSILNPPPLPRSKRETEGFISHYRLLGTPPLLECEMEGLCFPPPSVATTTSYLTPHSLERETDFAAHHHPR
jgi:hypothetical protein